MANRPWPRPYHLDRFLVLRFYLLFRDRIVVNDIRTKISNKEYRVIRREQAAMWMWTRLTLLVNRTTFMRHKAAYLFRLVVLENIHSHRRTVIVADC